MLLPRLFEWERGIALRQHDREDLTMFLWFYEWNMFGAMAPGQHTPGSYRTRRTVAADGASATIATLALNLAIEAVADGARLTLAVTNLTSHDWPEPAAIIPCWNPGQVAATDPSNRQPLNVNFADRAQDRSYFPTAAGLALLDSRAIHFNASLRPLLDQLSPTGLFLFSYKWPTSALNSTAGILIRESAARQWVTGIGWEDFLSLQGHNPWRCLHAAIRVGPLKRSQTKTVRGRLFLFEGDRFACWERFRREFPARTGP